VIVMDLSMPVMPGDEAAAILKADVATKDIPIVALTAYGFLGRTKARATRFDAYCGKPCVPQDLARIVVNVARRGDEGEKLA
jgi:CheY-like chemotaxis protein